MSKKAKVAFFSVVAWVTILTISQIVLARQMTTVYNNQITLANAIIQVFEMLKPQQ